MVEIMRNRKLFPTLAEANQTTDDCSGFCDPACPYNCYPFPDYYYLSPPLPPPPPTSLSVQNHYISPYVIIFLTVLASLLLLIGYYVIVVKSCFGWCCSRQSQAQTDQGSDEEFLDENRVDHPIWFITTVGLQQSIINSITVCKYKKGEGLIEGTECSVCLNEFQEGETVRLLPKCNHAFHISCIDTWLRAHTNCPLCRAHIVFDSVCAPTPSSDQNSDNIELIENSENGGEMSVENQGSENRASAEDQSELVMESKEIQQMKRCVSMDSSSSVARLFLGVGKSEGSCFDQQEDVENPNSSKQNAANSTSIADQHLHLSPVPMKRSFSCGGRFFSSSKRCRNMNSILPL